MVLAVCVVVHLVDDHLCGARRTLGRRDPRAHARQLAVRRVLRRVRRRRARSTRRSACATSPHEWRGGRGHAHALIAAAVRARLIARARACVAVDAVRSRRHDARRNDSSRARSHPAYWAFVVHRVSGLALALFLPLHFCALGEALHGDAALDGFLRCDRPAAVQARRMAARLAAGRCISAGGVRLLLIEFAPGGPGRDADRGGGRLRRRRVCVRAVAL